MTLLGLIVERRIRHVHLERKRLFAYFCPILHVSNHSNGAVEFIPCQELLRRASRKSPNKLKLILRQTRLLQKIHGVHSAEIGRVAFVGQLKHVGVEALLLWLQYKLHSCSLRLLLLLQRLLLLLHHIGITHEVAWRSTHSSAHASSHSSAHSAKHFGSNTTN